MNSSLKFAHPSAAGPCVAPGVPFSTRLLYGVRYSAPPSVLNNHDFIRAWVARRAAKIVLSARRAR